jgi:hypothetical protein
VAFVSEAVAALGDLRVSVGIATGPAAVAIEVLPPSPGLAPAPSAAAVPLHSPGAAAPKSPGAAGTSAADTSAGELCRYTVSGPAAEAAQRLERDGRPGFMHLSLAAADRLGAERGLFLDLAKAADAAPAGPGGEGVGPAAAAVARRRCAEGGRGLRHDRSVWIDCFHADRLLSADDLATAAAAAAEGADAGADGFAASPGGGAGLGGPSYSSASGSGLGALPEEDAAEADADE